MKFTLLASAIAAVTARVEVSEVKADSKFGIDLLSKSRRVEGNADAAVDTTWVAGYALKFQGCHHISQWNAEADEAEDVKIESVRLARFRLCPIDTCSSSSVKGCGSGYGDYIVDMDTFLASYLENKEEVEKNQCEQYNYYNCNCDNADDEEKCEYQCYKSAGMDYCIENDIYGYEDEDEFELANYLECAQYGGRRRKLDGANENAGNGYYNEMYIGPYCSNQGGAIVLGAFTDDTCTEFADSEGGKTTFYTTTGKVLPYSSDSIVDTSCWSCQDEENKYYAKDTCTQVYATAGKCETNLGTSYPNTNACSYMSGIKIAGTNGIINSGAGASNKVASAFIGIFSISFVLLGSYVYYLKTKLDRGKINLSD